MIFFTVSFSRFAPSRYMYESHSRPKHNRQGTKGKEFGPGSDPYLDHLVSDFLFPLQPPTPPTPTQPCGQYPH